jgi:hypothetical protein
MFKKIIYDSSKIIDLYRNTFVLTNVILENNRTIRLTLKEQGGSRNTDYPLSLKTGSSEVANKVYSKLRDILLRSPAGSVTTIKISSRSSVHVKYKEFEGDEQKKVKIAISLKTGEIQKT